MTTNTCSKANEDKKEYAFYIPGPYVSYITQAVTAGITSMVSAVITAFVIILVLIGGLWLAYVYLPRNVFHIVLAVLIVDLVLGIVLRALFSRR